MKKVSVCSIVKEEKQIALDFVSYLCATFVGPAFEILLVDNGLDEETRKLVSQFPVLLLDGNDTMAEYYAAIDSSLVRCQ